MNDSTFKELLISHLKGIRKNLRNIVKLLSEEEVVDPDPEPEPLVILGFDLSSVMKAFDEWDFVSKGDYQHDMREFASLFTSHLQEKFANVMRVNNQLDRHDYVSNDMKKHADAIVFVKDVLDPAQDIIVDIVRGASEGGKLRDNLQFLIADPDTYPW